MEQSRTFEFISISLSTKTALYHKEGQTDVLRWSVKMPDMSLQMVPEKNYILTEKQSKQVCQNVKSWVSLKGSIVPSTVTSVLLWAWTISKRKKYEYVMDPIRLEFEFCLCPLPAIWPWASWVVGCFFFHSLNQEIFSVLHTVVGSKKYCSE